MGAGNWQATGGSAQYTLTATGFRVYLYLPGITAAGATHWKWAIGWIASEPIMSSTFCASATAISGWVDFTSGGIYRDVDISGCGFTRAPIVSSSLTGVAGNWQATGGSAQYTLTATGFRVYVYMPDITAAIANGGWQWKIGWIASEPIMSSM